MAATEGAHHVMHLILTNAEAWRTKKLVKLKGVGYTGFELVYSYPITFPCSPESLSFRSSCFHPDHPQSVFPSVGISTTQPNVRTDDGATTAGRGRLAKAS